MFYFLCFINFVIHSCYFYWFPPLCFLLNVYPTVFGCFQGIEKGCIGNKWVPLMMDRLFSHTLSIWSPDFRILRLFSNALVILQTPSLLPSPFKFTFWIPGKLVVFFMVIFVLFLCISRKCKMKSVRANRKMFEYSRSHAFSV